MSQKYASVATADLRENSNLFDDVDFRVNNVQYTKEAPDNYAAEGNPIFVNLSLLLDGSGPEEERKVQQSYSCGAKAGDDFTISEDGYGLVPIAEDAALRKGSKWTTFTAALEAAGFPTPVLQTGDMSALKGLYAHGKRIADPARNFQNDTRTRPGQKAKFPPSTFVVTKILALPGEAAKSAVLVPKAPGAVSTTSAAVSTDAPADIDSETFEFLSAALTAKGGTLQRGQITLAVSKAAMGNPNRAVYAKRAAEESYLTEMAANGVIKFAAADKGQPVSLAA